MAKPWYFISRLLNIMLFNGSHKCFYALVFEMHTLGMLCDVDIYFYFINLMLERRGKSILIVEIEMHYRGEPHLFSY